MGASLSPAISKHLKAFLYGWLPLSDAYGIIFMLTAPIFNFSSLIFHLDAAGIIYPLYFLSRLSCCFGRRASLVFSVYALGREKAAWARMSAMLAPIIT